MKYSKTVRNLSTLGKVLNWLLLIPFVLFDKYALQYTFRKHIFEGEVDQNSEYFFYGFAIGESRMGSFRLFVSLSRE